MYYDNENQILLISDREIKEAFKSQHNYLTFLLRIANKTGNDCLKVILEQMESEDAINR